MNERIILKSKHYNLKKYIKIPLAISILFVFLGVLSLFSRLHQIGVYQGRYVEDSIIGIILTPFSSFNAPLVWVFSIFIAIITFVIKWWLSSYELTITDKRIYGKTSFGKRIDLPVDSISVVGTSALKGITIATSSGKIVFKLIKNRDDIHTEISNLIINRQSKYSDSKKSVSSTADELKKYKELLDVGAITEDEFDTKKKELLNS